MFVLKGLFGGLEKLPCKLRKMKQGLGIEKCNYSRGWSRKWLCREK